MGDGSLEGKPQTGKGVVQEARPSSSPDQWRQQLPPDYDMHAVKPRTATSLLHFLGSLKSRFIKPEGKSAETVVTNKLDPREVGGLKLPQKPPTPFREAGTYLQPWAKGDRTAEMVVPPGYDATGTQEYVQPSASEVTGQGMVGNKWDHTATVDTGYDRTGDLSSFPQANDSLPDWNAGGTTRPGVSEARPTYPTVQAAKQVPAIFAQPSYDEVQKSESKGDIFNDATQPSMSVDPEQLNNAALADLAEREARQSDEFARKEFAEGVKLGKVPDYVSYEQWKQMSSETRPMSAVIVQPAQGSLGEMHTLVRPQGTDDELQTRTGGTDLNLNTNPMIAPDRERNIAASLLELRQMGEGSSSASANGLQEFHNQDTLQTPQKYETAAMPLDVRSALARLVQRLNEGRKTSVDAKDYQRELSRPTTQKDVEKAVKKLRKQLILIAIKNQERQEKGAQRKQQIQRAA